MRAGGLRATATQRRHGCLARGFGICLAALLLAGQSAQAAFTWDGLDPGPSVNWSADNWDVAAPANNFSDAFVFAGTTNVGTLATPLNNDLTGGTAASINFNAGAGAFFMGGNSLTLAGNITNGSANLQTINFDLATTAVRTVTTATGGGDFKLAGIISGTGGGLTKAGSGTLTLSNASNSYTGTTSIDQGTLAFTADQNLSGGLNFGSVTGTSTIGTLDLNAASATFGGTMVVNSNSGTANTIQIGAGKKLTVNNNVTIGYAADSTSKLTLTGSGEFAVVKSGGEFRVGGNVASGTSSLATLDMSGLTTFSANLGTTGKFIVGDNYTANSSGSGNSTLILAANSTITAASLLVDHAASTSIQTMTVKLGSGTNTINVDTLNVGASASNMRASGKMEFNTSTGTLKLRGSDTTGKTATVNVGNNPTSMSGTITALMDLNGHNVDLLMGNLNIARKNGGNGGSNATFQMNQGTLIVDTVTIGSRTATGTGNPTGNFYIGGGNVTLNTGMTLGAATAAGTASANFSITGGTVTFGAASTGIAKGATTGTVVSAIILNGGTLDLGGKNIGSSGAGVIDSLTLSSGTLKNVAEINGGGSISKGTAGTLTLDGTNTWTGGTAVTDGTLIAARVSALPGQTTSGKITVAAAKTLQLNAGGSGEFTATEIGNVLTNATFTATAILGINTTTGTTSLGLDITPAIALSKLGSGTLTLSGTNTYTGGTNIDGGTLSLGSGIQALGGSGTVASVGIIRFGGGTLQFSASNTTDYSSRFSEASGQAYKLDTNGQTVNWGTGRAPTGTGTLTKAGLGTLNITTGTNRWTGATSIEGGVLNATTIAGVNTDSSIGKGSAGGSAADLVIAGGTLQHTAANVATSDRLFTIGNGNGLNATLDSSAADSAHIMNFTGTGAIAFGGSGSRTLGLSGTNLGANSLAAIIGDGPGGASSVVKGGTGSWTLGGDNSYTGTTTVNGGTLVINGNQGGATGDVLVNAGATLKGRGTIGGATNVNGTSGEGNAATHAPGTGVGTQTIANDLNYGQYSIFEWELASNTTSGRGTTGFDAVNITGAGSDLVIDAAATFKIVLGTNFNSGDAFWLSFRQWDVFAVAGSKTDTFEVFKVYNASAPSTELNYASYGSFGYAYAGNTGYLSWTPVPELSNLLAGGVLGAGLMRRRRKPCSGGL